jgi:hypothetical protein
MTLPVFIELPSGVFVNAMRINYILPQSSVSCTIHFSEPSKISGSGSWNPGGAGSLSYIDYQTYTVVSMSAREVIELINKELALIHAITKAAGA